MKQQFKIFSLIILLYIWVTPVFAFDIVFDPTVAMKIGSEIGQLAQQIDLMGSQLKDLDQQLNALKQLSPGQYQWSNAQNVINNLGDVVSKTNGLSYNAQNLDQSFRQAYPGYQPPKNYGQQYETITNTTINTLNGVLQSIGSSAQDFQNENSRLAFLQQQSQSAVGQTQAIQAASQIASEQVSQLQLLRQTLIAQTNAQTTYYAAQIQKEASSKAEIDNVIKNGSTTAPGIGQSGNQLNTPDY